MNDPSDKDQNLEKIQTNVLNDLKLDQALRLAKKHVKDGLGEEAKRIYQDILAKFPKNKNAINGMKTLSSFSIKKNSKEHNPSKNQLETVVNLYTQGNLQVALKETSNLLEKFPNSVILYNIQGVVNAGLGQPAAAIISYQKAISINPKNADTYYNMGVTLQGQGKLGEAIESYNNVISINPDYVKAYHNKGNLLKEQGMLSAAVTIYKKALAIEPNNSDIYCNIGASLQEQGKLEEAIEAFNKAISINPEYAEAYYNMGITLQKLGELKEAIKKYQKAILIKTDYAEAYGNMGNLLKDQGKLDEAIEAYNKALSIKPDYAEIYFNLGVVLQEQGKLDEAIEAYNKALYIKPDYAEAFYNMGAILQDQGKPEKAIEAYKKAIAIKPHYADSHQNLSFVLLKSGRLKEGLDEYEWRWKTAERLSSNRHFSQPLWDGQKSLKGKTILLWSEQGIGDTLAWSSGLSFIASQAEHCILECQQKLVPLLARSLPNVEVMPENRRLGFQRDDFDFHLPIGSLYRHFITEVSKDRAGDSYLIPDAGRIKYWYKRLKSLATGPYIGISWKSSNMSPMRLPNYASISELSPLLKIPDVTFINLQYKDFEHDLSKIKEELGVKVHNFDDLDHFENIDDVAALSAALDTVVSTQSVVPLISAGVGTITKLARWKQGPWSNMLFEPVGPLVDIFERNTWEPWDDIFKSIAKNIASN